MAQDAIRAPEVTTGPGYGLGYALYLHSVAWVLRKSVLAISGMGTSFDKIIRVETPALGEGHVNVAVCLPKAGLDEPKPLLLAVEGGGFVLGQPTDGEHIIRPLSDELGVVVLSVEYAKSPRYPYPHALLQLYEVIRWATGPQAKASLGALVNPARVGIIGNSAGGNLTASLTLLLSITSGPCARFRNGLPNTFMLAGQVLLYPSVACSKPYADRYKASDAAVRAASLPIWAASLMEASYLPPYIDTQQIFIAPVDADVELLRSLHLPATLCLTAGKDCLKFEAIEYTDKLEAAGVKVVKHEYSDAIHGFSHHKKDYFEDRKDCWRRVHEFLRAQLI